MSLWHEEMLRVAGARPLVGAAWLPALFHRGTFCQPRGRPLGQRFSVGVDFAPQGTCINAWRCWLSTWSGGGRVYHWHLVDRGRGTTKHPTMHRQPPNRGSSCPNVRGAEDGRTRPAPSPVCRALEAEPVFWGVRGCRAVISLPSCSLPGLVNNTGIDWFMPWPSQALHAVAKSFLGE